MDHQAASPCIGVGLRHPHYPEWRRLLEAGQAGERQTALPVDFVEVHSENFFAEGGAAPALLREVRRRLDVSLHGVGLGLGSACGVDTRHLERLARLVEEIQPLLVSDHACFARAPLQEGAPPIHGADLLPLAFTPAALAILAGNVQRVQERLRRPILVENLSAYLSFEDDTLAEPAFLAELCHRTGCGLLLDVNNLVVNARNAGARDPAAEAAAWIEALPEAGCVGQIHLAGHAEPRPGALVIDDHSRAVPNAVWQAYAAAVQRFGSVPTLVEWDCDLPALPVLLAEARKAGELQQAVARLPARGRNVR